jgi:hypothetical protein
MFNQKNLTVVLNVLGRCYGNNWYVSKSSLVEFVKTGSTSDTLKVSTLGNPDIALKRLIEQGAIVINGGMVNFRGTFVELFKGRDTGIIKEFIGGYTRSQLNFPENLGCILDQQSNVWSDTPSTRITDDKTSFFTKARKQEAHEQIAIMLECAGRVGIRDKMFLGFGGTLGYAWCNDFLPKDDDIDICFLPIPQEQRVAYLAECDKSGLLKDRMKGPELINGEYVWFSIGRKSPLKDGVKACNWFWFDHGGYWWHSKGRSWSLNKESHDKYPTSKGIPDSIFTGELREIAFGGNKINIPVNLGSCLDWWYPHWIFREQKSSAPKVILVHPDEADKKTWFIERR